MREALGRWQREWQLEPDSNIMLVVGWREAAGVTVEIPPPVCLALKLSLPRTPAHPIRNGPKVPNVGFKELYVGSGEEGHRFFAVLGSSLLCANSEIAFQALTILNHFD